MTDAPTPTAREIARALGRAARGVALDVDEATALLHARGDDLADLLGLASAVRDRGLENAGRPGVITYSRKVFVPLTRLCRDRCHYCTFATDPASLRRDGHGLFLSPDEVLDIARAGAALGCKEALFTLGDRPEDRWPAAREWLDAHGYDDTLSYVRAMAVRVLEETGLLPHLNPGVLSWEEIERLKPVAPSMGLMLETSATRLWSEPGGPHFGSPDKDPAVRLRVLADAGRQAVPFTTGILVGIGETPRERVESMLAIRRVAREYGHVQEVIVQNFRAKPDTAMRHDDDLPLDDYLAAIAVTRLLLGPRMRVQAPPNLTDIAEVALLLRAGVDDWGGVSPLTPDHVNPERPWPHLDELARLTAAAGFTLRERLTAHPEYVLRPDPWLDPRVRRHVAALADAGGLGVEGRAPVGLPWQDLDPGYDSFASAHSGGRTDLHESVDTVGRTGDRRCDFDEVYGDWAAIGEHAGDIAAAAAVLAPAALERLDSDVREALSVAARRSSRPRPPGQREPGTGTHVVRRAGARRAHGHRRRRASRRRRRRRHLRREPQHQLHERLLHRVPLLRLRTAPHRCRRLHAVALRGGRPRRRGVGRRRDRGLHAGRHPPRPPRHGLLRPRP